MMWFKACPRCHTGDLHLESDMFGKYLECMQCGYLRDLVPAIEEAAKDKPAAPKARSRRTPQREAA